MFLFLSSDETEDQENVLHAWFPPVLSVAGYWAVHIQFNRLWPEVKSWKIKAVEDSHWAPASSICIGYWFF